jgi:hypothetical protein
MADQQQQEHNRFMPRRPLDDEVTVDESMMGASRDSNPVSLDGCLYCRRGRSSGNGTLRLRRRFVSLSLSDGGSIKVFKDMPVAGRSALESHPASSVLQTVYSKVHRSLSYAIDMKRMENLDMYIPTALPWVAKDVENDSSNFVIEIPSSANTLALLDALLDPSEGCDPGETNSDQPIITTEQSEDEYSVGAEANLKEACFDGLREELGRAHTKEKPLRVYFRCSRGSHEKALWLRAFSKVGRLSTEYWSKKKGFFSRFTAPSLVAQPRARARNRRESHLLLAQDTRHLDLSEALYDNGGEQLDLELTNDVEKLIRGSNSRFLKDREYRVLPTYAYPHRWMTRTEMNEEMIMPSEHFHDLRVPGCKDKEIGSLRVEVLQCLGLPKLDRTSDTDACAYLVCGSYAFATDIIPNRMNPVWLRKSKRACEFPLFHGYARLYIGVFDDDGKREKDDFAGRVVVDLARLRPRSTYDVTLPMRLSTHVYSRKKRGAIRLRFTLNWNTERDALLSYLPKSLKFTLPQNSKPNLSVTVNCSDEKAFRNIAITVHGAHMPGRFTFHQMRSSIRELNYTRKYLFTAIRQEFRDTRHWQNPAISGFTFCAWMHAVYANAFSLVPAYLVLYFFLFLMRTYVKYGIEGPSQTGFIPPSFEEMFMALVAGGDPDRHAIETLELRHRPSTLARRADCLGPATGVIEHRQHKAISHEFRGKFLFRLLGFFKSPSPEGEDISLSHLEFPFANAADYPKFGTKECLVDHKGEKRGSSNANNRSAAENGADESQPSCGSVMDKRLSLDNKRRFPLDMPQFPLDMPNLPEMMRKDLSGLKEFDEEEYNFTAGRAVVASGKKAAKTVRKTGAKAARTVTTAATKTGTKLSYAAVELTEATGLNHVVYPISDGVKQMHKGVSSGMNHMIAPVQNGMHQIIAPVQKGLSDGMNQFQMRTPMHKISNSLKKPGIIKRGYSEHPRGRPPTTFGNFRRGKSHSPKPVKPGIVRRGLSFETAGSSAGMMRSRGHSVDDPSSLLANRGQVRNRFNSIDTDSSIPSMPSRFGMADSMDMISSDGEPGGSFDDEEIDPAEQELWPEQNIDIEGKNTGKKLTDDLVDIKDKVHELTWHRFDDHVYAVKPDSVYFRHGKKSERRRKDIKKQLNKLLNVGQYSHSNPFVARVGLYVDPIIGSLYSFLCLFRAGFNVFTWQDPILTFWLSLVSGCLAFVLFFFPWRLFLFLSGFWFVGPQNWIIRILRERGHLPPLKKRSPEDNQKKEEDRPLEGQPIFTENHRKVGNDKQMAAGDIDPREVHSVVVPCSPMMYQRFYDWPPEPMYAQVKPDASEEARRGRALNSFLKSARRPQRKPSILIMGSLKHSGARPGSDTNLSPANGRKNGLREGGRKTKQS